MHTKATLGGRFWAKVDTSGDCWLWTAGRFKSGYGAIYVSGTMVTTHRVAYQLTRGVIPAGMSVLHHCDNPPCVRPDHLFLGDQAENVRDMDTKRRRVNSPSMGEAHGCALLTEQDVRDMRAKHIPGSGDAPTLAAEYGVKVGTIYDVLSRRSWPHVV